MSTKAIIVLGAGVANAADEYNTATGLTAAGAPLGLHGVDPVAFIKLGNCIDGSAAYSAVHDGDPRYAAVENGKLYVFLNEEIFSAFQKDRAGTTAKAEKKLAQDRALGRSFAVVDPAGTLGPP